MKDGNMQTVYVTRHSCKPNNYATGFAKTYCIVTTTESILLLNSIATLT